MKLLLTSAGLRNDSIARSLISMLDKPVFDTKVGFVSTAANVEEGNKDWFIRQLTNLQKYGFEWIDVVDIALPEVEWRERLKSVDIIFVCGGNTFYLLEQMRKTGFDTWLKDNLDTKVYVGISAGSIVATPTIAVAGIGDADENRNQLTDLSGLNLVSFEISPHTNDDLKHEVNRDYKKTTQNELFGLDNESALKVENGTVEIITEGECLTY